MTSADQAELAALRIILSNLVARYVTLAGPHGGPEVREMLTKMRDECRLAAERAERSGRGSQERDAAQHRPVLQRHHDHLSEACCGDAPCLCAPRSHVR